MIIAVDFDGTIVTQAYPAIGKATDAIPWLKQWVKAGAKIILYTMRSGHELDDAVAYLTKHNIPLLGVNHNPFQAEWTQSEKVYANCYVDDAAFGCPLIEDLDVCERPYVDWDVVGPMVLDLIVSGEGEKIAALLHPIPGRV